jgi:hypothetical protein
MSYPPGIKVWHCCDTISGAFFNLSNVIFDKSLSNRSFSNSEDEDDNFSAHLAHATVFIPTPVTPNTFPPPTSPHIDIIHHSG